MLTPTPRIETDAGDAAYAEDPGIAYWRIKRLQYTAPYAVQDDVPLADVHAWIDGVLQHADAERGHAAMVERVRAAAKPLA